jgi:hypothetical protein
MPIAAAVFSLLATVVLALLAALSSPQASALPADSAAAPSAGPTVNPTLIPKPPLKCLQKNIVSYCIPNTFKYQVCSPTTKVVECPIDSFCKETTDAKGNTIAYCKFTG